MCVYTGNRETKERGKKQTNRQRENKRHLYNTCIYKIKEKRGENKIKCVVKEPTAHIMYRIVSNRWVCG